MGADGAREWLFVELLFQSELFSKNTDGLRVPQYREDHQPVSCSGPTQLEPLANEDGQKRPHKQRAGEDGVHHLAGSDFL